MLTKFESRSHRVKGLSFHSKRPWILAALHNGHIQLWDYRMGTLIERFEEHDAGPVRGVDFHHTQPLFCSGGDDYKIKVWNHKLRRCLFTLLGHLDYIRTVNFHRHQPWIVSASDDQTLRIWNWQGRTCNSVLTGHNHYVMAAFFHPSDELVVSASLDQTLRVWDIHGLRKQKSQGTELLTVNVHQEIFGTNDVIVKLILEGHDKGVNWASFHPTHPLVVSGADDRSIRIWKMDDARGFEIERLHGHVNNVSCVMYFKDYLVSNSEDRSIRVWDVKQRSAIHTFRRESDRFWVLAVHPDKNLIAAGHDSGMIVFKLERERPAHCLVGNVLYWVKDRHLKSYEFDTGNEETLVQLRRSVYPPLTVSYCPSERQALFYYDYDGGTFELYNIPKSGTNAEDVKKGFYTSAVHFTRSKFAVLDKTRQAVIRNRNNDIVKVLSPIGSADFLMPAANGQVLARADDKVSLFDMSQKKVVGECSASKVKSVVWAADLSRVALLSKHAIVVANRRLRTLCSLHEHSRVKSAAFDENGILIYTTLNHLKYCLPTGDTGTIKTLENPIYLVKAAGNTLTFLDREAKVETMTIDSTEYRFKMALANEQYKEVLRIVKQTNIHGQALVSYLQQKSFSEVAMHFVKDPHIRFNLAIECGDLEVAKNTAMQLNNPDSWRTLADVAMKHGNIQLYELAYSRTGDTDKLMFLAMLTGNREKLESLVGDAGSNDLSTRFQYSLLLGDAESRIRVLEEAGQYALAYKVAESHGLTEKQELLAAHMKKMLSKPAVAAEEGEEEEEVEEVDVEALLSQTPTRPPLETLPATCVTDNWPLLPMQPNFFLRSLATRQSGGGGIDMDDDDDDVELQPSAGGWGDDALDEIDREPGDEEVEEGEEGVDGSDAGDDDGGGEWGSDLDIDVDPIPGEDAGAADTFVFPHAGQSTASKWTRSQLAVDHAAAGAFESGIPQLQRQVGIAEFGPLKQHFLASWMAANAPMPTIPGVSAHILHLNRPVTDSSPKNHLGKALQLPALHTALAPLKEKLKAAYKLTSDGKFAEAQATFRTVMHACMFVVCNEKDTVGDLKEVLHVAREYSAALGLELARRETEDVKRQLELGAYFTHANLQPGHMVRTLHSAMSASYKAKNWGSVASFARRLLELNSNQDPKKAAQARKLLQLAEQNSYEDAHKLDYDDRNPFVVCGLSLRPIYRNHEQIRCSFCYQPYTPTHQGAVCAVCQVGSVGGDCSMMLNTYQ